MFRDAKDLKDDPSIHLAAAAAAAAAAYGRHSVNTFEHLNSASKHFVSLLEFCFVIFYFVVFQIVAFRSRFIHSTMVLFLVSIHLQTV